MDKTFLGRSIEDFAPGIESKPITKVELLDENGDIVGVAGNDSGKTLTAKNPDGTNEMAQAILAKVSGYTHIGYEGQNAMIDPAAEIGDAVTVSGHYVPIVSTDSTFDSLLAVNISAPDADELDDEYPYKSKTQRQIERNMAVTRSLITKSAEEINLEIQGVDGRVSAIQLTLDGLTIKGSDGVTRINGGKIEANSVTATQIDATNLKVKAANITGTLTIGQLPDTVAESTDIPTKVSELSNDTGYQTETGVTTIIDGRVTTDYVNALGITATYVSADAVLADGITLNGMFHVPGYGYIGGRNSIAKAAAVMSGENMKGYCLAGSVSAAIVYDNYKIWVQYDGAFTNDSDGISVYSDRRMKHDIRYDIDRYDAFFNALKPASFLFNGDKSGRRKIGMIAQDVLAAMELAGIEQSDFSALKYSKEEDRYFLAYEPFISLCIEQIQRLKKRLDALETKLEVIA